MSNRARPTVGPPVDVVVGPPTGDVDGDVAVMRRQEEETGETALPTGGVSLTMTGTLPVGERPPTGPARAGGRS